MSPENDFEIIPFDGKLKIRRRTNGEVLAVVAAMPDAKSFIKRTVRGENQPTRSGVAKARRARR